LFNVQANGEFEMAYYAASRRGQRLVVTPVMPALHRRLKIRAAETDLTLEATCRLAFEQFLGAVQPSFPRSTLP
jgi:hypothetical protein